MRTTSTFAGLLIAMAGLMSAPSSADAQPITGLWDASVVVNKLEIPFRFEIAGSGAAITGSFFNGDEKVTSTIGTFENASLTLNFDEYGSTLTATLKDGRFEGEYSRGTRGTPYAFQAKRFTPVSVGETSPPSIAGLWNIQVKSSKGESAWQLIVRQSGGAVSAAILRVDGDTGLLTGEWNEAGRHFVLSHFSGARPMLLELSPAADGTLAVTQNRDNPLTAVRSEQARAKGLPEPSDPSRFTSVKDPTEALRFSFPDLTGKTVSNTDPKFSGKVVVVNIGGSWCPNCHDEAPFLADLYRKYHNQGLEVVLLSFEEAEQLKNPVRLRAFIKRYGIDYTVLLPGEPKELADKMPQGVNLSSFPTSFILGRDGRVRSVHAGFPGAASGDFHKQAKAEISETIERLLHESAQTSAR